MGPTEWGPCTRIVTCPGLTRTVAYWNNTVATSPTECDIITYDTLTGSQTAILSGHAGYADSLAFSLDGTVTFGFQRNPDIAGNRGSEGQKRVQLIAIDYRTVAGTAGVECKGDRRSKRPDGRSPEWTPTALWRHKGEET